MGKIAQVNLFGCSALGCSVLMTACGGGSSLFDSEGVVLNPTTVSSALETNALIAFNGYNDSLSTAQNLLATIETFIANPSPQNLMLARQSWIIAREPYGQTEAYRFRLGPIDSTDGINEDGPEGQINAWPLGEALIDYVAAEGTGVVDGVDEAEQFPPISPLLTNNAIADTVNFPLINSDTIASLNEADADEANVATGYHAIEFLLWGQDLYETGDITWDGDDGSDRLIGAGERPYTDYVVGADCTSGPVSAPEEICVRRGAYLVAATELLIDDLTGLVAEWNPNGIDNHYSEFVDGGSGSVALIFESMGRLGFGELAGERMNIALEQDSQEDEQSCFSDNTHRDIVLNQLGIFNSYFGTYGSTSGFVSATEILPADGTSLDFLLREAGLDDEADTLSDAIIDAQTAISTINGRASIETFDIQIAPGNITGNSVVRAAIDALVTQTNAIEAAINALGLQTEDIRQDTEEDI